nr:cell wall hydrolase [Aureimonas sp. AU12]
MAGGCARVKVMSSEECLARAMYFESNRSSPEGMMAVGTVVMNRLESGKYPQSVCGVVGQKNQFAPGVLSKPMGKGKDLAVSTARQVIRGQRHPRVQRAMFFHTAGYSYPYSNMQYLTIQGGNAFYEKRKNANVTQTMVAEREKAEREGRLPFNPPERAVAVAAAPARAAPVVVASGTEPRVSRRVAAVRPVAVAPARVASIVPNGAAMQEMSIEDLIQQSGG